MGFSRTHLTIGWGTMKKHCRTWWMKWLSCVAFGEWPIVNDGLLHRNSFNPRDGCVVTQ